MKKFATLFCLLAMVVAGAAFAQPGPIVTLNEIRVDQTGTDVDEYVEFAGAPGTALTGLTLVVIGDGTGGCGVVENAVALGAYSIQADGLFALRISSGTPLLAGYDATVAGSMENSDNLSFFIVSGWTGAVANDLDADNNGTLDAPPWNVVIDQVSIFEGALPIDCSANEYTYATPVVGPDGTFAPGHILKCAGSWYIGPFDPATGVDTPGSANNCATPANSSTWGQIKTLYR